MRGVGQTNNLIYTLPNERCMIVVKDRSVGRYIEERIKETRGKDFEKKIKVVCISEHTDLNKMMGYSHLVFFDHSFFESVDEEIIKKALDYAEGAAIVYHSHKRKF